MGADHATRARANRPVGGAFITECDVPGLSSRSTFLIRFSRWRRSCRGNEGCAYPLRLPTNETVDWSGAVVPSGDLLAPLLVAVDGGWTDVSTLSEAPAAGVFAGFAVLQTRLVRQLRIALTAPALTPGAMRADMTQGIRMPPTEAGRPGKWWTRRQHVGSRRTAGHSCRRNPKSISSKSSESRGPLCSRSQEPSHVLVLPHPPRWRPSDLAGSLSALSAACGIRVTPPRSWGPPAVLVICLGTGFTTLLDQAILNVAVPALRTDLSATGSEVQWILAIYSLTFGLALVPAGRLGDTRGRGRFLVGGLALFSVASLLGAAADDPRVLFLARLLQGAGAGMANPQVIGLIQDHFTGPARSRAFGAYATVAAVSATLAPVVGGLLLTAAGPSIGWRLVMAVNVPFGAATCLLAVRGLDLGRPPERVRPSVDLVGIGLLSVITLAVLLPLVGGPVVVPVVVGLGALAALPWWERGFARRGGVPVLLPALVRSPGFVLGTVVAMCWFGSNLGTSVATTLALQERLGLSPLLAGLCLVPQAVAMGLMATVGWRLIARWGRALITAALSALAVVLATEIAVVLLLPTALLPAALVLSQLFAGIAGGLVTSPNQALTLAHAPPGAHGLAAGFFQVSQRISSTICIAACTGAILAATGSNSQRTGLMIALIIALSLIGVAVIASAFDRRPLPASVAPTSRATGGETK